MLANTESPTMTCRMKRAARFMNVSSLVQINLGRMQAPRRAVGTGSCQKTLVKRLSSLRR